MTESPADTGSYADGADAGARNLGLVTVSLDLGAGRRGVDMGPSAIRIAGLRERLQQRGHRIVEIGAVMAGGQETTSEGDSRARYLAEITSVCQSAHRFVIEALDQGCLPLILGGDHSLSAGTVSAVAAHHHQNGGRVGLLWVDAHTDMNIPATSPSGNVHGMGLATLLGRGPEELVSLSPVVPAIKPENACVIGARSIDRPEKELVREAGLRVITMTEIDERGMAACMDEALERVGDGTEGFHLSFDLDVVDPMVGPGVGTPIPGGITYREAHLVCEKVARTGRLLGLEVVELNPVIDAENRTGRLAVGLLASALGERIL